MSELVRDWIWGVVALVGVILVGLLAALTGWAS